MPATIDFLQAAQSEIMYIPHYAARRSHHDLVKFLRLILSLNT